MKVVTVATHSEGFFPWFRQSCLRHGLDCVVLGWGQRWQGFNWRLSLLMWFVAQADPEEVLVVCDAYDVIMLQDAAEMERRFRMISSREGKPIVVGSDEHDYSWPVQTHFLRWYFGTCQAQRINAGCWMGRAKDIGRALDLAKSQFEADQGGDDQVLLTSVCRRQPDLFYIDARIEVFLVAVDSDQRIHTLPGLSVGGDRQLSYRVSKPCLLHAAGGGDMTPILRALGYPVTDGEAAELARYLARYRCRAVWRHIDMVVPYLIVLAAVVYLFCRRRR